MNRSKLVATIGQVDRDKIAIGAAIGFIVSLIDIKWHLKDGFVYGDDILSNLAPALYFRYAVVSGDDPLTTPWYGGMALWENSFFKGLYPPWSVFFIPGVPMDIWLSLLWFGHVLGAGIVSFYYARKELRMAYAIPIAFILTLPALMFGGHFSKLMAWPWVLFGLWQLRPDRLQSRPRLAGAIIGLAGGAVVLTSNAYYALYLALLAGSILLAVRAWRAIRMAAVVSLIIGAPKLATVVSIFLKGGRDTTLNEGIGINTLMSGLIGFSPSTGFVVFQEAYAVVSLPVCLLAVGGFVWAYVHPDRFPTNWMLGCLSAVFIGLLIVTASPLVYRWPAMETFRVPDRAVLIIAGAFVLVAVETIQVLHKSELDNSPWLTYAMTVILTVGVVTAAIPPLNQSQTIGESTTPAVGQAVAATVAEHDCNPVWFEINANWDPDDKSARYHQQVTHGLAERGIPAVATYYAKMGQDYATHDSEGDLTFEALILQGDAQLPPNRTVTLTGGWFQPDRGQINTSQFDLVERVDAPRGDFRIYATNGTCNG